MAVLQVQEAMASIQMEQRPQEDSGRTEGRACGKTGKDPTVAETQLPLGTPAGHQRVFNSASYAPVPKGRTPSQESTLKGTREET